MSIEGMFSLIIPAHKLYKRIIDDKFEVEACIDSILDQDYDNYEIILVANGPGRDDIASFVLNKYGDKVKVLLQEVGNAALARNAGAKEAKGEYRSYFSSDLTMYPGILQVWKNAFDNNPDAAIIYSKGIDWVKGGKPLDFRAYVDEFDSYRLTCHNLIDGANPVRAKDDQEWDSDVPALQDWNWALKVLKPLTPEAKKAVMIEETAYTTEQPKEGGLSDYFSKHWEELNKQIKDKRGLPQRNVCVSSLGAPFHGLRLAKCIDADFNIMPSQHPHSYDVVHLLGYYISNIKNHNLVFNGMKRSALKTIHWIGTDILQLMFMPWIQLRDVIQGLNEYIDIHFCECESTQQELGAMGINAVVLPLPVDVKSYPQFTEVPAEYTVAVYAPYLDAENSRKYNLPLMFDIARAMPDFKFIFFGSKTGYPELPPNCEGRGWVDIKEIAKDANIILRLPFHDGLPISVCEFLLMGRDAITSVPMIGSYYGGSGMLDSSKGSTEYDTAKANLIKLLRKVKANPIDSKQRQEIVDHYKKFLDPERFRTEFKRLTDARQAEVLEKLKAAFEAHQKEKSDAKD